MRDPSHIWNSSVCRTSRRSKNLQAERISCKYSDDGAEGSFISDSNRRSYIEKVRQCRMNRNEGAYQLGKDDRPEARQVLIAYPA